jgi:predicted amidohydrolase
MKKDIRAAAVVCRSLVGRKDENLRTIETWTRAAASRKADVVCFPESCITGYHTREEIMAAALPIDGPEVNAVIRMAREYDIAIIAGLAERGDKGQIYATAFACSSKGMLGIYRKVHLGPPETARYTPADQIGPLFDLNGFKFGIQLCYDAHFPEISTYMADLGADAIFIPHASPGKCPLEKKKSWMRHLPARAFDNGLFIIATNPVGENGYGLNFPGTALMLSPSGKIIAHLAGNEESLLVSDLTIETLESVRHHRMRYFFPNRRPGLYSIRKPPTDNH